MPTYQYACTECSHAFDQVQSFTDDTLTECPECAGRLRKIFNAVGVVFKGSGFYRNDSRSASSTSDPAAPAKSDSGSSDSSSGAATAGSSESGSGSTPAKKSEPAASSKSTSSSAPAASGSK